MERITTLSELIETGELNIRNVRDLPVSPKMSAASLQEAFDKDTENLVEAIDKQIVNKLNSADLVARSELDEFGGGDMLRSDYDPDNTGTVLKAKEANKISDEALNIFIAKVCDEIYPVGSIKITVNNVNPSVYIGGTWVQWGSGRVPVGVNSADTDFSESNKTGGIKEIDISHHHLGEGKTGATTLTTAQIPAHTHTFAGTKVTTDSTSVPHKHAIGLEVETKNKAIPHTHGAGNLEVSGTAKASGSHSHNGGEINGGAIGIEDANGTNGYGLKFTEKKRKGSLVTYETGSHTHSISGTISGKTGDASSTSHNHSVLVEGDTFTNAAAHAHAVTAKGTNAATGGGGSHTHAMGGTARTDMLIQTLQPYITCYMWRRTA